MTIELGVDGQNRLGELGVGALTLAGPLGPPSVVALAGHAELVAHEGDRVLFFVSPVRDRRIFHGCSFANQPQLFSRNHAPSAGQRFPCGVVLTQPTRSWTIPRPDPSRPL